MNTVTAGLAWHNDPALKAEVIQRLRDHRAADEIVKGAYQVIDQSAASGYRGCAIGCTLPRQPDPAFAGVSHRPPPAVGWHGEVARLYGIHNEVGRLIDQTFEALPIDGDEHAEFAVAVIEAVPVGADLSLVSSRLMLDVLADDERGVLVLPRMAEGSPQRAAVEQVAALYRRRLEGEEPTRRERIAAAVAAAAAEFAVNAADAYTSDDYDYYDYFDDEAVVDAAATAAYAAAAAAHISAAAAHVTAQREHWRWVAARLIQHLTNAPLPAARTVGEAR